MSLSSAEKFAPTCPDTAVVYRTWLQITACYSTIGYTLQCIFGLFVDQVTTVRCTGDREKSKATFGNVFILLGNRADGKMIKVLEGQTRVTHTEDEKSVDRAQRSVWFEDVEEVGAADEIQSHKPHIIVRRSHQVGIAVYQRAKLCILELYYDFLDRYIDRKDDELIKMDTDSPYVGLSTCSLDDVVHPLLQYNSSRTTITGLPVTNGVNVLPGSSSQN